MTSLTASSDLRATVIRPPAGPRRRGPTVTRCPHDDDRARTDPDVTPYVRCRTSPRSPARITRWWAHSQSAGERRAARATRPFTGVTIQVMRTWVPSGRWRTETDAPPRRSPDTRSFARPVVSGPGARDSRRSRRRRGPSPIGPRTRNRTQEPAPPSPSGPTTPPTATDRRFGHQVGHVKPGSASTAHTRGAGAGTRQVEISRKARAGGCVTTGRHSRRARRRRRRCAGW